MPSAKNLQAVETLKSQVTGAKAVVLADYLGLTVSQMGDLRDKVRAASGSLVVAKNTLLKLALSNSALDEALHGSTILLTTTEDEIGPLKALVEFSKDTELPKVKAGIIDGKVLSADELLRLAKLPGRQELYAQLVGTISAPLSGLANVLTGPTRKLVYVLNAITSQNSKVKS